MTINDPWNLILPAIISIFVGGITVAITFYIKDILKKKSQYKKMKHHLDKIAGKNATIIYSGQVCKIAEIDESGITLKNKLGEIYIPIEKALTSEITLPYENYEKLEQEQMAEKAANLMRSMVPVMTDELFPKLMGSILNEFSQDEGDFSMVLGIKLQKFLKDEGYLSPTQQDESNKLLGKHK